MTSKHYKSPADKYRQMVRSFWIAHPAPSDDSELYSILQQLFEDSKVDNPLVAGMAGVGLMTYGRTDVISTVIESVPKERYGSINRIGAWGLVELLPLPDTITSDSIRYDKASIHHWLDEHQSDLFWDQEQGKFILRTDGGKPPPPTPKL